MDEPEKTAEDEALWRFSLAFYALPEVGKERALALAQDAQLELGPLRT